MSPRQLFGWFVGCVEKQGKRYYFATNIQAPDGATGGKAREISKAILKELGVL
ncbi:MAG TPA: penicillin-binding transpeptidase domain-containing protein [Methylomusa anaerophila]|uniref:penicillin-binding transpeptidase domain-containing protein n=1 Tax=Methylomusa anaerophila TaxID=1930071 RepID=UPI000F8471F1|nr:penicillin-binding transpeptidase domain-containing protein [Methylomusa anaerophila]HML90432.1 penicillin-binding transpeptidase domain-containing protein [Methylomusa anaerophila]